MFQSTIKIEESQVDHDFIEKVKAMVREQNREVNLKIRPATAAASKFKKMSLQMLLEERAFQPSARPADDFTIIKGIDPDIQNALRAAKILTFYELSKTKIARFEAILKKIGKAEIEPSDWPMLAKAENNRVYLANFRESVAQFERGEGYVIDLHDAEKLIKTNKLENGKERRTKSKSH